MSKPAIISYRRAMTCCMTNQLATPGLGTLIARRWLPGIGQLVLSVVGFVLLAIWWIGVLYRIYLQQLGETPPPPSHGSMGKWGLLCFGTAWLWSLATSWSLLRESKTHEPAKSGSIPPRITGPPTGGPG